MNLLIYIKKRGLRESFRVVYRYKIDKIFQKVLLKLTGNKVKDNVIVIESHNDYDSNGGAFYDYLIKKGYNKKYKIVWLIKNRGKRELPYNVEQFPLYKPSLKKDYYITNAKYLLTCQDVLGSFKPKQESIYLTHGPVGLKAFKGKIFIPDSLNYCLMPSEYLLPILRKQYCLNQKTKTVELGYPSHDIFYTNDVSDIFKLNINREKVNKIILWMPTFRKRKNSTRNDSKSKFSLGIPILKNKNMLNKLNQLLKANNSKLIIKIHPMQDISEIKINNMSNIVVLSGEDVKKRNIDNYRLMKGVDALISDYSSVAYDFLHMNKPIGFTMDDIKDYKPGFIVNDPDSLIAGQVIYNFYDFIAFIKDILNGNDPFKIKRNEVFNKVFKFHDGKSSERLAKFMGLN